LLLGSKATLAGTLLSVNVREDNALMPRCCFALFAIAKKTRLGYDSLGGKHKGEGKTAVDSPSLYQHKCKLIALSSLPCPAPVCEPFRASAIPRGLVYSP